MTKRIIPSDMVEPPVEAEIEVASTEVVPKQETARVVNDKYGMCPICHQPMKTALASGVRVHTCIADRIAMPVREDDPLPMRDTTFT